MIRLIALDIDGTLVDSRWQVPDANRRAITLATSLGVEVALVTGRRFDFTRAIVDQLEGPLTLIVNNGALVKARDGSTLRRDRVRGTGPLSGRCHPAWVLERRRPRRTRAADGPRRGA
jgi:5-amino-6-(5-phospho-D-ribitylamino)uracil phosphatase